jgi:hypothetical protein
MAPRGTRKNTLPTTGARQGRHAAETRGQVSDWGKKPYRQKGASRAQGSLPAPQYVDGGRARCGRRCAVMLATIASAILRGPVANACDDPRRVGR